MCVAVAAFIPGARQPPGVLHVTAAARDEMVAHARKGAPEEVCGVLAGERRAAAAEGGDDTADGGDADRVEAVHRTANATDAPRTRYRVDPEELLATVEAVEAAGRDVVGFYHSHPRGPLAPSATDEERATWTGYLYLVVSLAGDRPELGAWRWTGDGFEREPVRVVGRE